MSKFALKSKTISSALVIGLIAIMSLLGVGEQQMAQTYDTISEQSGVKHEDAKDIITILAAAGVIYGRKKAKDDIKWSLKKDE